MLSALAAAPLAPPGDFEVPETGQAIFTFAQIVPVGFCLFWAVRFIRTRKDPALLFCMLGALLACFIEPILDLSTNVWLGSPAQGQWNAFDTLGHPFPLWTLGSYTWYVGGQAFLVYYLLSTRGLSGARRLLWLCFAASVVTDFLLEEPGLALKVYDYYGPQALEPGRLPLFWLAANSAIPVVLGAVLYLIRPRLDGWKNILIIPTIPVVTGAVWGAVLFPVANAQNAADPPSLIIVHLCGVATIALSVFCVWLASQILPGPGQTRSSLVDEAQQFHRDIERTWHATKTRRASDRAQRTTDDAPVPASVGAG